jgi:hypothetical protein
MDENTPKVDQKPANKQQMATTNNTNNNSQVKSGEQCRDAHHEPPKVGGWESNATYVNSPYEGSSAQAQAQQQQRSHQQAAEANKNPVAVRMRNGGNNVASKLKRASWALRPFSFPFAPSSSSQQNKTGPTAFTDAPATMTPNNGGKGNPGAASLLRPIPVKGTSPPQLAQQQVQAQPNNPANRDSVGASSAVVQASREAAVVCPADPDLFLPPGKCVFTNKFQDNQKPLPRYGFHFNMLPAKKMCQASTGEPELKTRMFDCVGRDG